MKISMKRIIKAKEKLDNVRKPMYAISDSIVGLEETRSGDNNFRNLVNKLKTAHKELRNYLDSKYLWD